MATLDERLDAKIVKDECGCWIWQGRLTTVGYGQLKLNQADQQKYGRKHLGVHRFAYERWVGPIPEGMVIDHLCRNRACVNPEHLEPVTHAENILRGESIPAQKARATLCIRGHELDYIDPTGRRGCKTCRNAAARAHWRRQKVVA